MGAALPGEPHLGDTVVELHLAHHGDKEVSPACAPLRTFRTVNSIGPHCSLYPNMFDAGCLTQPAPALSSIPLKTLVSTHVSIEKELPKTCRHKSANPDSLGNVPYQLHSTPPPWRKSRRWTKVCSAERSSSVNTSSPIAVDPHPDLAALPPPPPPTRNKNVKGCLWVLFVSTEPLP